MTIWRVTTILVPAFLLAMPGGLFAADSRAADSGAGYHWPLPERTCLTSTFAEYRARHFHGGVDFSTGGEEGKPVFAVTDGEVYRIVCGVRGFGRALYLRLGDGNHAVYAHLSRFRPDIEAWVVAAQLRDRKYVQDLNPEPGRFPVRRGDVIAWSGQSGAGPPHLHLEIRANESDPVNPLAFGLEVNDRVAPSPSAVAIEPLDREGRVDGRTGIVVVPLRWSSRERAYVMTREPSIQGRVGYSVASIDNTTGCDDRLGPYRAELWVDGRSSFEIALERVSYVTAPEADVIFRAGPEGGRFFRLHRVEQLPPSTLGTRRGDGVIEVFSDIEAVRLAELIELAPAGPIYSSEITREIASEEDDMGAEAAAEESGIAGMRPLPISGAGVTAVAPGPHRMEIILRDFYGNEARIEGRFRAEASRGAGISGARTSSTGASGAKASRASSTVPTLDLVWRRDFIEAVAVLPGVVGSGTPPAARLDPGPAHATPMKPLDRGRWIARLDLARDPAHQGEETHAQVEAVTAAGDTLRLSGAVEAAWLVRRNTVRNVSFANGAGHILFGQNALYFDSAFRVTPVTRIGSEGELEPVGTAWRIEAADVVFNQYPWVGLAVPEAVAGDARVALYRRDDATDPWRYVGRASPERAPSSIGGADRALGTFTLMRDRVPPRIEGFVMTPVDSTLEIRARVRDGGAGLDPDGITLILDGAWVPAEWDPERDTIRYVARDSSSRAGRRADLTVVDRAGNRATARLP